MPTARAQDAIEEVFLLQGVSLLALDTRVGGGAHVTESQLSNLATCGFGVRTSPEAHNRLSCPRPADTALKTLNLLQGVLWYEM